MTTECRHCDSTDLYVCRNCHDERIEARDERIEELQDELRCLRSRWLVRLSDWLWGFYCG